MELTDEAKRKAGYVQMMQYLGEQYPEWHLIALKSIKKIIINSEEFYSDIISNYNTFTEENVKREIHNGCMYEAVSHAEQSIEDLFSLLKCVETPDNFVKKVIVYRAGEIKDYIWNYKTDDLEYILEQFCLP